MSKHRTDLTKNTVLPSTWVNALMEFVSTLVSNLIVTRASDTTVSIVAAAGTGQVSVGMGGPWRYNTATATASHPGGAAGLYDIFVTGAANDNTAIDPADATNYAFGLAILAQASVPGTALYRKIGECVWDGSRLAAVYPVIPGALDPRVVPPVGSQMAYAGTADPPGGIWLLADGRLLDRTTAQGASFFGCAGHAYNNGVDPGSSKVKLCDKRGRGSVGADVMRTVTDAFGNAASGAAGVLTAAKGHTNSRGTRLGAETHQLAARESGVNDLGGTTSSGQTTSTGPTDVSHFHGFQAVALSGGSGTEAYQGGVTNRSDNGVSNSSNLGVHTHVTPNHSHPFTARPADNEHNNVQPSEVDNWIVRVL